MLRILVVALLLPGCSLFFESSGDGDGGIDAGGDGDGDGDGDADIDPQWQPWNFAAGVIQMPPEGMSAVSGPIDTDSSDLPTVFDMHGQEIALISANEVTIGSTIDSPPPLQISGARPLLIVGNVVTITGVTTIRSGGSCSTTTPAAGAGGAGGSGSQMGGAGGANSSGSLGPVGAAASDGDRLQAGCPGDSVDALEGGGGAGGGALHIVAFERLTILASGDLGAGGEGGFGGTSANPNPGGGGGGAGGMIVLDSPTIETSQGARIGANGGGGGGGASTGSAGSAGSNGSIGSDGGAGGAQGTNSGGSGGTRDADPSAGGDAPSGGGGGGGGGGGAGYIYVNNTEFDLDQIDWSPEPLRAP